MATKINILQSEVDFLMQLINSCWWQFIRKATVFILAIMLTALVFPLSFAVSSEWQEYELDLGPQGKDKNRDLYGYGIFESQKYIDAGAWGTWQLTYHVGRMGIDDGGRIFLLFHLAADWGPFQTEDPKAANYVSATTTGRAKNLIIDVNRRHAGLRPYWNGLVITARDGDLKMGDTVTITLGDQSGGGPGVRAPTVTLHLDQEFRFMVDPMNGGSQVTAVRLLGSPQVRTVAGQATRLEALWPSEAVAGEETWLLVKAKDKWGNAAKSYEGEIQFDDADIEGLPQSYRFLPDDQGFHRFDGIKVPADGDHVIDIRDIDYPNFTAQTNVMMVKQNPSLKLYCGDLHGQNNRDSATVEQYASYARGFGGTEFMSWGKNDFHVTSKEWDDYRKVSEIFNEPGRFVVFPGYEWSGTTGRGGDHNVIYLNAQQQLYRSGYVEEDLRGYAPETDRYSIDSLVSSLDPNNAFLMPHIGGRRANLDFYNEKFMPFIEIYSDHGQFEWFLREALDRGLKVGFTASSDDAYGKMGDSIPGDKLFAVHGGITCVYANDLSRRSLWQAFKSRRVYGTTGERMQLRFKAGEHWLGEEISSPNPVTFSVETSGTAGIDRIDIFRGSEKVHTVHGQFKEEPGRIKLVWRGAASKERARQTIWQGEVGLSDGKFIDVLRYRLDYPLEELSQKSVNQIIFNTITAGDEDGVVMVIDAPKDAKLTLNGSVRARNQFGEDAGNFLPLSFSIPLDNITNIETVYSAGGVDREVAVRKIGRNYPRTMQFEWTEKDVEHRPAAYWVRVLQEDGATAWSSPIFVESKYDAATQ